MKKVILFTLSLIASMQARQTESEYYVSPALKAEHIYKKIENLMQQKNFELDIDSLKEWLPELKLWLSAMSTRNVKILEEQIKAVQSFEEAIASYCATREDALYSYYVAAWMSQHSAEMLEKIQEAWKKLDAAHKKLMVNAYCAIRNKGS